MPIGKQFNPLSAKLKPKIGYTPAKHKLEDTYTDIITAPNNGLYF